MTSVGAAELYRQHARFVLRFLVRLGIPERDVEDLVQEVFLVAHRRGGFTPGAAEPTTWLAEIAVRVASNFRRSRRRRPEDVAGDALALLPASVADAADVAESRRALARVAAALDTLPLERRAVFVLFELEGQSCESIAAGLGVPVGTVYSRLHAARREFTAAHDALTRKTGGAP